MPTGAEQAELGADRDYTYEREVEEFLRWSPHVHREREGAAVDREPLGI